MRGEMAALPTQCLLWSQIGSSLILQTGFSCCCVGAGRFNYSLTLPAAVIVIGSQESSWILSKQALPAGWNSLPRDSFCHHKTGKKAIPSFPPSPQSFTLKNSFWLKPILYPIRRLKELKRNQATCLVHLISSVWHMASSSAGPE